MHSHLTTSWLVALSCSLATAPAAAAAHTEACATPPALARARVPFIANHGQVDHPDVRFYAQTFAGTVFVTGQGQLVYSLPQSKPSVGSPVVAIRETFAGRHDPSPRGLDRSSVRVSSFKGPDPALWHTAIDTYNGVDLGTPFPGIRVTVRAAASSVEKLFHVAAGANVEEISVTVDGIDSLAVNDSGELLLGTALGDVVFTAPVAYQEVGGSRRPVEVAYALTDANRYGFTLGPYDRRVPLVIDPVLASTYLGGHNPNPPGNYDDDIIYGMVASDGDLWVAGATQSPDFPIHLGYDETLANAYPDGFITRMSADLTTVIASTYLGTDGFDRVTDIAMDDDGSIVAVGQAGYGFPVTDGAYTWSGTTPTGGGFVARLSADLSTLLGSAVPTPGDYPRQVALGNNGVYFGGTTNNPAFPITAGAYKTTCCPAGGFGIREYNGFAGELSADLATLEAMTYLGGSTVSGIAVAADGSVYVTDGFDSAVTGYLARFDASLTARPGYLSYYPGSTSGSSRTYFNDVAVADGDVVAVGQTYMNDLPATPGAYDTTCGTDGLCDGVGALLVPRSDGFVARYSADLGSTVALTYLGGSYHESIRAVSIAADGGVVVSGETISTDFPTTPNGADTSCGTDGLCNPAGTYDTPVADGFVARLAADLSTLQYGTYLGGSDEDLPQVTVSDPLGLVYAAGYTRSADFPTTSGAFDTTFNGGTSDAFITRIDTEVRSAGMVFADDFEAGDTSAWSGG